MDDNRLNFDNDFIYGIDGDYVRIEKGNIELSDHRIATTLKWFRDDNKSYLITDTYGYILGEGKATWYGTEEKFLPGWERHFMD